MADTYRNFLAKLRQPGQIAGGARNYLGALQGQGLENNLRQASAMSIPGASDVAGLGADAMMYARDPESRTWGNAALSVLGALPIIPAMTAYHGSPHKFDKFELSDKTIGTGEGAQAYGHGLYFAEDPGVAGQYVSHFSEDTLKKIDRVARESGLPDAISKKMTDYLAYSKETPEFVADLLSKTRAGERIGRDKLYEIAKRAVSEPPKKANLYHVDIPDEQIGKMLDWDAPLSEQPEAVRKAFEQIGSELNIPSRMYDRREPAGFLYGALSEAAGGQENASKLLRHYGIPGIRYLDGTSRKAGEGTRNFVVFDDSILKILNRE